MVKEIERRMACVEKALTQGLRTGVLKAALNPMTKRARQIADSLVGSLMT